MKKRFIENAKQKLQKKGYRLTGPRLAIMEYLNHQDGHPNIREIYEGIKQEYPGIGIATVYRTVDLLVETGILRALNLNGNRLCYDIRQPQDHHHHLICTGCGRVTEFDNCNFNQIAGEVERATRFRITEHTLEAFGTCPRCLS